MTKLGNLRVKIFENSLHSLQHFYSLFLLGSHFWKVHQKVKVLHSQHSTPDRERALYPFLKENRGLRFADFHPCRSQS